jgi:hypothetical protein
VRQSPRPAGTPERRPRRNAPAASAGATQAGKGQPAGLKPLNASRARSRSSRPRFSTPAARAQRLGAVRHLGIDVAGELDCRKLGMPIARHLLGRVYGLQEGWSRHPSRSVAQVGLPRLPEHSFRSSSRVRRPHLLLPLPPGGHAKSLGDVLLGCAAASHGVCLLRCPALVVVGKQSDGHVQKSVAVSLLNAGAVRRRYFCGACKPFRFSAEAFRLAIRVRSARAMRFLRRSAFSSRNGTCPRCSLSRR